MNFKKIVFSMLLFASFSFSSFANVTPVEEADKLASVSKEIKEMIQDIKLDYRKIDKTTVKIKFIINDSNELIVLSTDADSIDNTLKNALNYKKVDAKDVKHNFVYIVPVKFKA